MSCNVLTEELIKSVRHLKIQFRRRQLSRHQGEHYSGVPGDSLEFHDFRSYSPGDDLRRVDWNIFQRHRKLFLRQFRHFQNNDCCILLDNSASMHFGPQRRLAALRTAAVIGGVLLRQNDRLEFRAGGVPPRYYRNGGNDLQNFFSHIEALAEAGPSAAHPAIPANRKCWVISDFLDPDGLDSLRKRLAASRPFTPVRIFTTEDIAPRLAGNLQLIDCESGHGSAVSFDRNVLAEYQAVYREFVGMLDAFAARGRTRHYGVNADDPAGRQLETLFPGGIQQ